MSRYKLIEKKPSKERQLLIGLIVSTDVCKNILPILRPDSIESSFSRTIIDWCKTYFEKYKKCPAAEIQTIYEENKDQLEEEDQKSIETLLESISGEYERLDKYNSPYAIDILTKYIKGVRLKQLSERIRKLITNHQEDDAEKLIEEYETIQSTKYHFDNPIGDSDLIRRSFEHNAVPLFKFPSKLGALINYELCRDCFVAIQAPEKRGKTYWLMEFALRAVQQRCNVLFLQVGDMSAEQQTRRIQSYISKQVLRSDQVGEVKIPVLDCKHNQDNSCGKKIRTSSVGIIDEGEIISFEEGEEIEYIPCSVCRKHYPKDYSPTYYHEYKNVELLEWDTAIRKSKQFEKYLYKRTIKLGTHPSNTIRVKDIHAMLDQLEQTDNFLVDVVVIDYADILAPENNTKEYRHQINETWKALRSLSQQRHCLVVTATQSDVKAHTLKSQTQENFSDDKRKYAHVTLMLALNQTNKEKEDQIYRMAVLMARENEFHIHKEVTILHCLKIGRPYLQSF